MTTTANGFSAMDEPVPISIAEDNVAPFSLPQEILTFQPDDLALISRFTNGDQERKIHCNIELRPDEFDRIKALQDEAKKLGRTYYLSITVMATRYISYARGDPKKAIAMMDETQEWRKEFFGNGPLSDASLMSDMSHGILYFTGRDFALRPILVIRAERLPQEWYKDGSGVTRLIKMLVFCMEYLRRYMFIPGIVENIVVLIDLKNLGISQVPVAALKSIYSVLSHHYIVRVFKFYIVNMSYMLSSLISVVKPILSDRQRQKLNFPKSVAECKEWCALHQLEEDLGGTRPKITTFFPFPLQPGPFAAGSTAGPRSDAVKNLHKAYTAAGFRGRIWDRSLSKEENSKMEYTDFAEDLFNACSFPIPPGCPVKAKEPEPVKEPEALPTAQEGPAAGREKIVVSLDGEDRPAPAPAEEPPKEAPQEQPPKEDATGRPIGALASTDVSIDEKEFQNKEEPKKEEPPAQQQQPKCCCAVM